MKKVIKILIITFGIIISFVISAIIPTIMLMLISTVILNFTTKTDE